jgi:hypothetical protein
MKGIVPPSSAARPAATQSGSSSGPEGATPASAAAPPSQPVDPIQSLSWLVGGTWIADGKLPDGSPATVEATFEWAHHKRAVKYAIVKRSAGRVFPTIEGLCGWHPGRKTLVLWEVDQDGSLTESTVRVGGNRLSYDEVIYSINGSRLPVRAEAVRESEDRFVFRASIEKDGSWPVVFEAAYSRRQ